MIFIKSFYNWLNSCCKVSNFEFKVYFYCLKVNVIESIFFVYYSYFLANKSLSYWIRFLRFSISLSFKSTVYLRSLTVALNYSYILKAFYLTI